VSQDDEPVVLELIPLPREQIGPFLLLGLEKTATPVQIEAHWAQRVLWSRKGRIRTPLEDVNWARQALRDADQRAVFESATLNVVLSDGYLHQLAERFGIEGRPGSQTRPLWKPCQEGDAVSEKPLAPGEVPDPQELIESVALPPVDQSFPSVAALLRKAVQSPVDPWSLP
jgi:hypothetical protein